MRKVDGWLFYCYNADKQTTPNGVISLGRGFYVRFISENESALDDVTSKGFEITAQSAAGSQEKAL